MSRILFYAKPGCIGNRRQRRELERAGHQVDEIDLLAYPWSRDRLTPFLRDLTVADWFNRSAPAIKNGVLNPDQLDAEVALGLLLQEPLLIRRPLMQIGEHYLAGFDPQLLQALLGTPLAGQEACPRPVVEDERGDCAK
ncbi:ArsC/Spx/MgsR family protein [Motiliproteus sediminis]|uniref:ArsC/Spx/MgsR family protein n=1 Tax=Motiliproteus sediminis TaxID=1468178 RepID=UPI001AEF79A7|nr:ArsC/Spx/MgsR family protein [Motiliproteus sediminis]